MKLLKKTELFASSQGLISFFIVTCFLLSLFQNPEAYAEMKKVTGTSKIVNNLLDYEKHYGQSKVRFVNILQIYSSAEPDWNNAKVFNACYYVDSTHQGDDYDGCLVIMHPNGDQTFMQYEGSWNWVLPRKGYQWISDTKGRFTGGTGKFKGIRGSFKYKGKGDGKKDLGGEWVVEYEIVNY